MTSAATGPAPAVDTATWPRRMLALLVDWAASTLVVVLFVGFEDYFEVGSNLQSWTLLVYVVEATVLTATVGGSFGQVATRLRVVSVPYGAPVPLLRSLVRHVMVILVIPPLVFRPDGRGLHDVVAGSATITLQTYRGMLAR